MQETLANRHRYLIKQSRSDIYEITLVFNSTEEAFDRTYGLVFIPCPVWVQGEREILNLNPRNPHYQLGSLQRLIDIEKLDAKKCYIAIHSVGNGTATDLTSLKQDMKDCGILYKEIFLEEL